MLRILGYHQKQKPLFAVSGVFLYFCMQKDCYANSTYDFDIMRIRRIIFVLGLLLFMTVRPAPAQETAYYFVGWLNNWSTSDQNYPLTQQPDGVTWEITLPAAGDGGWFKIAPASAYGQQDFWNLLLCAPYDGCRELTGTMSWDSQGAWLLPNLSGVESYTLRIIPSTMQYELVAHDQSSPPAYSGTLPVLYINTEKEVTSKETYVTGTCYIDALGLEGYSSLGSADSLLSLQMKGRGNYTWSSFEKKPYRLKFDTKQAPLGMKKSKHFALMANADDNMGFLRNTVGFELSRMMKLDYTPEQRPVELILNGHYLGLYMLTEQIRVSKNRVNVVEQADNETDTDNVTGGWLLEIDNYKEPTQVKLKEPNGSTLMVTYKSPEVLSDVQLNYLTNFLKATDAAIYNNDKNSTEWEQYIDIDALARYYIVQEVMDDGESFHGSCYMHKDRGADTKLVFGPVWDFGNAFSSSYDKFIYVDPPFEQFWIGEIARYPHFQQTVREVWHTFLGEEYPHLEAFINDFIAKIASAAVKDGERWPQYSQNPLVDRQNYFMYRLTKKVNFLIQEWGDATNIVDASLKNEKRMNHKWYTLDGRQLDGYPQQRGIYVHDGKKVVVKKEVNP